MTGFVAHARVDVDAPPERVWEALTDPEEIAQYMMGSRVETDWRPGSPITWSGEYDGRPYQDKGEVFEARARRAARGHPLQRASAATPTSWRTTTRFATSSPRPATAPPSR